MSRRLESTIVGLRGIMISLPVNMGYKSFFIFRSQAIYRDMIPSDECILFDVSTNHEQEIIHCGITYFIIQNIDGIFRYLKHKYDFPLATDENSYTQTYAHHYPFVVCLNKIMNEEVWCSE